VIIDSGAVSRILWIIRFADCDYKSDLLLSLLFMLLYFLSRNSRHPCPCGGMCVFRPVVTADSQMPNDGTCGHIGAVEGKAHTHSLGKERNAVDPGR
jgi:hypothetical protein